MMVKKMNSQLLEKAFTKKYIKNSIEYQWRLYHIKLLLIVYSIIVIVSLFVPLGLILKNGIQSFETVFITWLCCMLALGIFVIFILYYIHKCTYLIKNYEDFICYEVVLNNISTSYTYKASIYYSVTIDFEGDNKIVDTNAYFSSSFLSKYSPEEYDGKTVIGLYDNNLERFYIIKKVD